MSTTSPAGQTSPKRPSRRISYPDLSSVRRRQVPLTERIPPGHANRSGLPIEALGWILLDEHGNRVVPDPDRKPERRR